MYAFTSTTIYPDSLSIPQAHIDLLDEFFRVIDSLVNDSPSRAEEFTKLFSQDGVWKTPSAKFVGHEELVRSGTSWQYLKTLKWYQHSVAEVYGSDTEGKKLMLIGKIALDNVEGQHKEYPFSARVEIEHDSLGPKMTSFQGWSSGF